MAVTVRYERTNPWLVDLKSSVQTTKQLIHTYKAVLIKIHFDVKAQFVDKCNPSE